MSACWMLPPFDPVDAQIRVVLPVCNMDAGLMLKNLEWQCELDGRKPHDCVLSIDPEVPSGTARGLEIAAWNTYSEVNVYQYPEPPNKAYPNASNWAFQHTARYMMAGGRSWYWMEADAIPVRPGWLTALNQRYNVCQMPMMGSIVRGMGHCNGTAIYPANFPQLSDVAMTATDIAWDGQMMGQTIHLTHDASDIMCHVWGIERGWPTAFGGRPIHFNNVEQVRRWVCPKAVVFHRNKDGSLIDQLRVMMHESLHVLQPN